MSTKSKQPAKAAKSEVQHIKPAEGWKNRSKHGLLRCDDTAEGALVLLADVVRWLMETLAWPRLKAVDSVCAKISADATPWIYSVSPGDYAKPQDIDSPFIRFMDGNGSPAEKVINQILGEIRRVWSVEYESNSVLASDSVLLGPLAVKVSKANELWGYGHVDAGAILLKCSDPETLRSKPKSSKWTEEHEDQLLRDFTATKGATVQARRILVGKQWGIGEQAVKKQLASMAKKRKPAVAATAEWFPRVVAKK